MKYAVAIDIGGTNTRVALVDEEYKIEERAQFSTDADNPEVTLFKIKQAIDSFDKKIVGVGMSCPGPLDLIEGKNFNYTKSTWRVAWTLYHKRIRKIDS